MSKGKKPGDRSELLTKEEMDRLLWVVSSDIYFKTLYTVLRQTGRRIGEIYGTERDKKIIGGIKVKDINYDNKTMKTYILKTKKRKLEIYCPKAECKTKNNNKNKFCKECGTKLPPIDKSKLYYDAMDEKTITLKDEVIFALKQYINHYKLGKNSFLFREWSLIHLKKIIKKHVKEAEIKKNFSLHGFRHYFVTACKREGMTNEEIALWTGHKRSETLNIYNRMVPKDIEDKINSLDL